MTSMHITHNDPFSVLGFAVRTDGTGSATAIPELWKRVSEKGLLSQIPGASDETVYAVYSQLENAGRSREGWFTFLIGRRAEPSTSVPEGMMLVSVPSSRRASFAVPDGDPSRVVEAWRDAWAFDDKQKSFLCEYEEYGAHGASVNLGLVAGHDVR